MEASTMKKLDDKTKTGLVYLLSGTLLMLLAAKPPRILTKIYLALERAAALVLGFAMAVVGAAQLLPAEDQTFKSAKTVYDADYNEVTDTDH